MFQLNRNTAGTGLPNTEKDPGARLPPNCRPRHSRSGIKAAVAKYIAC